MEVVAVEQHIILLRGKKVMLDLHLADLYGVETKVPVQAVKRNIDRFSLMLLQNKVSLCCRVF